MTKFVVEICTGSGWDKSMFQSLNDIETFGILHNRYRVVTDNGLSPTFNKESIWFVQCWLSSEGLI